MTGPCSYFQKQCLLQIQVLDQVIRMKNVIPSEILWILQGKDEVLINVQVLKFTPTRMLTLQLMVGVGPALPRLCNIGLPQSETYWRFAGAHLSKPHLLTGHRRVERPLTHNFPPLIEIFIPIFLFPKFFLQFTLQALSKLFLAFYFICVAFRRH